jgi:hypothetical protein
MHPADHDHHAEALGGVLKARVDTGAGEIK